MYGAPQLSNCLALLHTLHHLLSHYDKYLIIGDINQLDQYSDKIRGNALIRGWEDIITWKVTLNLQDIPFSGPRFTWTNNREEEDLIMERLDRGYASLEWINEFRHAHIRNLPNRPLRSWPDFVTNNESRAFASTPISGRKLEFLLQ